MKSITKSLNAFTLFFLAVQLHQGASNIVTGLVGESVYFEDPNSRPKSSNLQQCNVNHNGVTYSIHPECNLTNAEWDSSKYNEDCSFWLHHVNLDDVGEWKIQSIWQSENGSTTDISETIQLYISKTTSLSFLDEFVTDVGHYITVSLEPESRNLTNCILIHYRDNMPTEKFNLLNANQEKDGIQRYEQCGARIYINESRFGRWTVKQNYGQYIINSLDFEIKKIQDADTIDKADLSWVHGSSAEIKLSQSSKFIYCKITKPNKRFTIIKNDFCAQQIDKVNQAHEGVWEIEYLIPGSLDSFKKKYNVKVVDALSAYDIKVSSNETGNKGHLLCTIAGIASEFCLFTKFDGDAVALSPGVGNHRYEYFGRGYQYEIGHTTYTDCGLTINSPYRRDYGLWQCSLGKIADPQQAYISFYNAKDLQYDYGYERIVYVKRGDSFVLECPRYGVLNKCEIRRQIGVIDNNLSFMGRREGLKDGICRVPVNNANDDNGGGWSCHFDFEGGNRLDIRKAISVRVYDSYVYSDDSSVHLANSGITSLTCHLFPTSRDTVSNCRWKHRDSLMVYVGDTSDYKVSFDKTSCTIQIKKNDDDQLGLWTCYLKMRKDTTGEISNEEEFAEIGVTFKPDYDRFYYHV